MPDIATGVQGAGPDAASSVRDVLQHSRAAALARCMHQQCCTARLHAVPWMSQLSSHRGRAVPLLHLTRSRRNGQEHHAHACTRTCTPTSPCTCTCTKARMHACKESPAGLMPWQPEA